MPSVSIGDRQNFREQYSKGRSGRTALQNRRR